MQYDRLSQQQMNFRLSNSYQLSPLVSFSDNEHCGKILTEYFIAKLIVGGKKLAVCQVYVYRLIRGPANAEKNQFGRYPDHVKFYQFGSTPHTFEICIFTHCLSANIVHILQRYNRLYLYQCRKYSFTVISMPLESSQRYDFIFVANSNCDHMYFLYHGELSSLYIESFRTYGNRKAGIVNFSHSTSK